MIGRLNQFTVKQKILAPFVELFSLIEHRTTSLLDTGGNSSYTWCLLYPFIWKTQGTKDREMNDRRFLVRDIYRLQNSRCAEMLLRISGPLKIIHFYGDPGILAAFMNEHVLDIV